MNLQAKRKELKETIMKYGISSKEALKVSQELDKLINQVQPRRKPK